MVDIFVIGVNHEVRGYARTRGLTWPLSSLHTFVRSFVLLALLPVSRHDANVATADRLDERRRKNGSSRFGW